MQKIKEYRECQDVVVILPYIGNRVLMQLRDDKLDIPFPGHWGFFGGAIDRGEKPLESAFRELKEEIGLQPDDLQPLEIATIPELDNLISHSFFCSLTLPVEHITLTEGMDLGLFSIDDLLTKRLYSKKMKKSFPIVAVEHINQTFNKLLDCIHTGGNHNPARS